MASKEPDDDDEWGENAAETPTRPKALVLHPWCWELRLMSALSELDETSALWLLRLLAASIGFYSVKSWLRHMTLEMHSKCIRASEIHTPLGIRENARSWLFDWSKPTDGATKLGQTPRTHCGVMASKKCEWCHSLRLISWVAWQ